MDKNNKNTDEKGFGHENFNDSFNIHKRLNIKYKDYIDLNDMFDFISNEYKRKFPNIVIDNITIYQMLKDIFKSEFGCDFEDKELPAVLKLYVGRNISRK